MDNSRFFSHPKVKGVTLAKVKKHITRPKRLVTPLSHCQRFLFTAHPFAFLFPLPSATGSLLFLDPPLQMIYFSLFVSSYYRKIQEQFSLAGTTWHLRKDICIEQ